MWGIYGEGHSLFCLCSVAQPCLTLYDPMDCCPSGSSVHGDSPGKNTGVGCQSLLQGIFLTQGSNPGLRHCRQILYHLSHKESLLFCQPYLTVVVVITWIYKASTTYLAFTSLICDYTAKHSPLHLKMKTVVFCLIRFGILCRTVGVITF